MKKNAFTNILFNWDNLAQNQKLQALQALENEQSKIQRRPARKIKMCKDEEVIKMLAEQNVTASAYVDDSKKDSIFILNLNCSAVKMIETIFHEGNHSMITDYYNDKCNLNMFSSVNKEKLDKNYEYGLIVYSYLVQNKMFGFESVSSYEECLVRDESIYSMLDYLMRSADNIQELLQLSAMVLVEFVFTVILREAMQKECEKKYGETYEQILSQIVEQTDREDEAAKYKQLVKTNKKIIDQKDKNLSKLYNVVVSTIKNISKNDKMLTEQGRDKITNEMFAKLMEYYASQKSNFKSF